MDDSLLNLDRVPTLEELREFFKRNDFSAATYLELDYNQLDADIVEAMECFKGIMDEKWEPVSREMGLKSPSIYYGKDNPLIALRDNMQNLVAGGVVKLLEEYPDRAAEILSQFMDDPNVEQNADRFLNSAVETLLKVMDYEEVANAVQDMPAYEDFNHGQPVNYRAMDFDRSWNHTRSKIQTVPIEDTDSGGEPAVMEVPDASVNVAETAAANIAFHDFWNKISDEDKKLLQMRMSGMSQKEIAESLGYKTHSAVTKRLQKLSALFKQYIDN